LQWGNAEDDYEEAVGDGLTKQMKLNDKLEEIAAKLPIRIQPAFV
jgi:hypothetical protein